MRSLKPTPITIFPAPFETNGKVHLVVMVGVMLDFAGGAAEQEQTLYQLVARQSGSNGVVDEGKPKVRGEWLVLGSAYAPGGKEVPVVSVRASVAGQEKELWAIGDRVWGPLGSSDPTPFTEMPLTWDRAFGGKGHAPNPIGKGASTTGDVRPLPNIELPHKRVASPRDCPTPAGFGFVDPSLPQRMKKLGTYDRRWFETRYPELAADLDPTYFNVAPEDQWLEGYFKGDEPFVFQNMHPGKPEISGRLPGVQARCFMNRRTASAEELVEIGLRCDTVLFFPHLERMVMMWRGVTPIEDELAEDVIDIIAGLEWQARPKPREHYERRRAERLDKRRGPLAALADDDLLPEEMQVVRSKVLSELDELLTTKRLRWHNLRRGLNQRLEESRETLRENGGDPDTQIPKLPENPPEIDPAKRAEHTILVKQQVEEAQIENKRKIEASMRQVEEECAKNGLDFNALREKSRRDAAGPPKFKADDELERLRELHQLSQNAEMPIPGVTERLTDPRLEEKLRQTERALKDMYRRGVHLMPPAWELEDEASQRIRREVEAALEAGESLAGRDLTGADLSGLDFSGRDLTGTFLEKARLVGCSFRGSNLERAVFARADLTGADFHGAKAKGGNFG
ncbi:MAG: DUF2169 domain-containing protein, partial [Minicystis sp.]